MRIGGEGGRKKDKICANAFGEPQFGLIMHGYCTQKAAWTDMGRPHVKSISPRGLCQLCWSCDNQGEAARARNLANSGDQVSPRFRRYTVVPDDDTVAAGQCVERRPQLLTLPLIGHQP